MVRPGVAVVVVPAQVVRAAQQAQGDARADVGEGGQGDEQRLRERGLVDLAREEEVGLGGGDGAGGERDQRGRGQVEGAKQREGVGGVALDAGYW